MPLIMVPYFLIKLWYDFLLYLPCSRNMSFKFCPLCWIRNPFGFVVHTTQIIDSSGYCPINTPDRPHHHHYYHQYYLNSLVQVSHVLVSKFGHLPCRHLRTVLPPWPSSSSPLAMLVLLPFLGTGAASAVTCFPPVTARNTAISTEDTQMLPLCSSGLQ